MARTIYRPTSSEEKKCADLLLALRVPSATYSGYRKQVREFLNIFAHPGKTRHPAKFKMLDSVLFGREYLVAHADAAWLREHAPGTDAIASPCVIFNGIPSPPLILIPADGDKTDDPAFLSILEHEFVHVQQALLGTFPDSEPDTADKWLKAIFKIARAEYEANLIQFVRWPLLYSQARAFHGISLEDFCALRGYTEGLQRIFHDAAVGKLEESELLGFLERLPAALPPGFRRIGLNVRLGEEYARKLPDHVVATLDVLTIAAPDLKSSLYLPALGKWLRKYL